MEHCLQSESQSDPATGNSSYPLENPQNPVVQRHLQARHMYYSVSSGSSGLVWTEDFLRVSDSTQSI